MESPEAQTAAANRLPLESDAHRQLLYKLGRYYTDDSGEYGHKNLDKEPVDSSETTKRRRRPRRTKTQVEANGGGGCC
jgi:hypothetical protein